LFGCNRLPPLDRHCLSELAVSAEAPLPEVRVDIPPEAPTTAVWITALRLGEDRLLLHLRQGVMDDRRRRTQPHWMGRPRLRIRVLGTTQIETGEIKIEGDWLLQRPGQLLKYLVLHRDRPVHVDEVVEALWPKAGPAGRNTVRHFVHALRARLEPERARRHPSSFIHSVKGTYMLDRQVELDLREFDSLVATGLESPVRTREEREISCAYLEGAVDLYRGDLFAEEPFADWAFPERERLRTLLHEALMRLVELRREDDQPAAAVKLLERCVDFWPLDADIQRALLELYVEQGRHSDAQRRYEAFRHRLRVEFAQEADFRLVDLGAEAERP
jgi:DNA-binding SARP family transcriptional activator